MKIDELVLQGVAGFADMTRVPLGDGVTVVTSEQEAMKNRAGCLTSIVRDLFYAEQSDKITALINAEGNARIGVVAQNNDISFRILSDLRAGRISVIDAEKNAALAKDKSGAANICRTHLGVPEIALFDSVFCFRREDLPSMRSVDAGSQDGFAYDDDEAFSPVHEFDFSAMTASQKQSRLEELKRLQVQVARKQESEFEIDGWRRESFELDEVLRGLTSQNLEVENIEREMGAFEDVRNVPTALFDEVASLQKKRNFALSQRERSVQLVDEIQSEIAREVVQAKTPAQMLRAAASKDAWVKWGGAIGVLAIVAALVGAFVFPPLRWVAFLNIPAFALAVAGCFRFLDQAEYTTGAVLKLEHAKKELEDVEGRAGFVEERMSELLQEYQLTEDRVADMLPELDRFREVKGRYDRAIAELEITQSDPRIRESLERRAALSDKIKASEEALYSGGDAFLPDMGTLEAEMSALVDEMSGRVRRAPKNASNAAGVGVLFREAADALKTDVATLVTQTQARCAQYIKALSNDRYGAISVVENVPFVTESTTQNTIAVSTLPPGDKDIVYVSARLTFMELFASRMTFPFMIDGALDGFPTQKTALLVKLLQFLGAKMQVLVVSSNSGLQTAARTRVAL